MAGNPWLQRRPLNIAHQGGSLESPANTMYAFATALRAGAHSLELDVHATADGELVVLHDATVDRTTDGVGRVDQLSLAQVRDLDAAWWFVPGEGVAPDRPERDYPLRGVARGEVAPPEGFSSADFTIPLLSEVFARFPGVHVNVDIKSSAPDTLPYERTLAELIARHDRRADVIVGSFLDEALATFKAHAPDVATSAPPGDVVAFWSAVAEGSDGVALPQHVALQVPVTYGDITVVTESFVAAAHHRSLAVHVWTVNAAEAMAALLDMGVDGVVTDRPGVLARVLDARR